LFLNKPLLSPTKPIAKIKLSTAKALRHLLRRPDHLCTSAWRFAQTTSAPPLGVSPKPPQFFEEEREMMGGIIFFGDFFFVDLC
jgi:hypothetical protein